MLRYLLAPCLLILMSIGHASPITYAVDQKIGTDTVVGSITTDGALGQLLYQDVSSFVLTIDTPLGEHDVIDSSVKGLFGVAYGSSFANGLPLFATTTALTFDTVVGGSLVFENNGGGQAVFLLVSDPGLYAYESAYGSADFQTQNISGQVVFASAQPSPNTVPEPPTLLLLGLVAAGVAGFRKQNAGLWRPSSGG